MEWRHGGSPRPLKFRVKNVLASIVWDQDGILLIDYLLKGQTINAEYYSLLLVHLKDILKKKRRGNVTKEVMFLHENAPTHRALATQKKCRMCFKEIGLGIVDWINVAQDWDQ
jgi:hypothetical protein